MPRTIPNSAAVFSLLMNQSTNENTLRTDSQDYGTTMYLSTENVKKSLLWLSPPVLKWFLTETTMYLSTENVKKSLLWLSPPVLKWFLTETDLSTLLRG